MSDEGYTFVRATIKDVETALELRRALFAEMGVAEAVLLDDAREQLRDTYTKAYEEDEIVHYFAYDAQGNIAAVVGALLKRDFPYRFFKPGYYGWIIDVYTDPAHRGRKLATKLMALTHEWLKAKGVQEAKLIAAGAEARRLYERLGYRATWELSYNLSGKPTYNELIDAHSGETDQY